MIKVNYKIVTWIICVQKHKNILIKIRVLTRISMDHSQNMNYFSSQAGNPRLLCWFSANWYSSNMLIGPCNTRMHGAPQRDSLRGGLKGCTWICFWQMGSMRCQLLNSVSCMLIALLFSQHQNISLFVFVEALIQGCSGINPDRLPGTKLGTRYWTQVKLLGKQAPYLPYFHYSPKTWIS